MPYFLFYFLYIRNGDKMNVKLFDFEHEEDLEIEINNFLNNNDIEIIDIKYQISHFYDNQEQIFSYSAMLIFNKNK